MKEAATSRVWVAARVVALCVVVAIGLVWRITKIPHEIHAQSTQLLGAITLQYLPITFSDFGAHVLDNFWKFLFHGEHALDDYAFYYLVIRTLAAFDLPILPQYIYLSNVLLNTFCVLLVLMLARRMFSPTVAGVAALFLWVNWELASYTRVIYNFQLPVTVAALVLYLAHLHYTTRTWTSTVLFALVLTYSMGTQFIFFSPVLGLFYVVLRARASQEAPYTSRPSSHPPSPEPSPRQAGERASVRLQWMVIAAPALAMVAFQIYLYTRLGESGLGMFARVGSAYDPTQVNASRLADAAVSAWHMLGSVFGRRWFAALFAGLVLVHASRLMWGVIRRHEPLFTFQTFVLGWLLYGLAAGGYALKLSYLIMAPVAILIGVYWVEGAGRANAWRPARHRATRATELQPAQARLLGTRRSWVMASGVAALSVYLWAGTTDYRSYEAPPDMPYKAVGYFVRTQGRRFARVFNVEGELITNILCQYYYGKNYQVWDNPERKSKYFSYEPAAKKLIFSSAELPLESLDRAGKVGRIDFYVFYGNEEESRPRDVEVVRRNGFVPVARVIDAGRRRATIFGRPELGYRELDMRTTNRLWEQQIATLPTLYEHHRIGVADFWGHWEMSADEVE